MGELIRFGVSIDDDLLAAFDRWIEHRRWSNRSEAIRDIIRRHLVEDAWEQSQERVVATLTFVYDHHVSDLQKQLTRIQHDYEGLVKSALHLHLDHHNCLEVLVMEGPADELQVLSDRILGARGVKHGRLVKSMAQAGAPIPEHR